VLCVYKNKLAPQALFKKLNTHIDWKTSGLKAVQEPSAWPETGSLCRAACCSYGYGGSISHAVIEQALPGYVDRQTMQKEETEGDGLVSLFISSREET